MPALSKEIITDIQARLEGFLAKGSGYSDFKFLDAGGSAAIFKVLKDGQPKIFKVFSPHFFEGDQLAQARKRLQLQQRLIGHKCSSLIETISINEAEGTAFIEMEYIEWPQLTKLLPDIPDDAIVPLLTQLVTAVQFLESLGIVHRDIKPENIHVSSDFKHLKLLDLGVVKEIVEEDEDSASATDTSSTRPFLATAQYSSPEYLFRLDKPSPKLWKGLNFYQIGAVLHDLINKKPIFQDEVNMNNRWLVARAVLTKTPVFADTDPHRLASLKALAARCLVKDIDSRLQQVGWVDFVLEGDYDPIARLRSKLSKGGASNGTKAKDYDDSRLNFDRNNFQSGFANEVRTEILGICATHLPITMHPPKDISGWFYYQLSHVESGLNLSIYLRFEWGAEVYSRTANIILRANITTSSVSAEAIKAVEKIVATTSIDEPKNEAIYNTLCSISKIIEYGLDLIQGTVMSSSLNGADLQSS